MKFSKVFLCIFLLFLPLSFYAQSSSGYSYGKSKQAGHLDSHFYLGIGFSNFSGSYLPTTEILDPSYDNLFLSGDFYFGLGYYVTNSISFGVETGFSFNTLNSDNLYYLEAGYLSELDAFWSWVSPSWLNAWGYTSKTPTKIFVDYYEIPIRFYLKFSSLGSVIRWISLEGFIGIDLTFTHVETSFYKQNPYNNYLYYSSTISQTYFSPNFTTGARLTLAFIGIEYSYHLPVGQYTQGFNYFQNTKHRISVGFSLNMVT